MTGFPSNALTVGGPDDPFLPSLVKAINHADEVAIAAAFIRMTGLRLIELPLREALARGARVRILTGDYLYVTEPVALRQIMLLKERGAEAKVFETNNAISFHMKTYLFARKDGEDVLDGCGFVGSSNLSNAALQTGFEWNLKVDAKEDLARFYGLLDEYEKLFQHPKSIDLSHRWIDEYTAVVPIRRPNIEPEPGAFEAEPIPTPNESQTVALQSLRELRDAGGKRGLAVMATGLGKTWLAAFDSLEMKARRVLFVAHREEILDQAESTFLRIHPGAGIGKYNGSQHDTDVDLLFASVQTLGSQHHLDRFPRDYFDYIVVDEFHHAAANTYRNLLQYFMPKFLLGLTATPQRTDQADILALCDGNTVCDFSLVDGINKGLLCPFEYYGIADTVDYTEISWRNHQFDPSQLYNQLATIGRAKHNFNVWGQHRQTRTLAFCISKKHADFMADYFSSRGVRAVAVHSASELRRNEALEMLSDAKVDIVFSVDLFNEGVDVPSIDTILMLRPTESKIVFLQQLGRGLRRSAEHPDKILKVIDFIGNHISFFNKPEALLSVGGSNNSRRELLQDIKNERLDLPAGCFVNFEPKVLDFLAQLITDPTDHVAFFRSLSDSLGRRPTLSEFAIAGGREKGLRKEFGSWWLFLTAQSELSTDELLVVKQYARFLEDVETTKLTKSFKLVLLQTFIEVGGFTAGVALRDLALKSHALLLRRKNLSVDTPEEFIELPLDHPAWERYWRKHPVNAWVGGNTDTKAAYFEVLADKLACKFLVSQEILPTFLTCLQEVVDYRFFEYEKRLVGQGRIIPPDIGPVVANLGQEIPYFSDLRIACGHFRSSGHETANIEMRRLPIKYGRVDPSKSFLARAVGDSMNGGKNPIKDGDVLLLEAISPDSAGSISGQIIAIEREGAAGDDQYLLRYVVKNGPGNYELRASNASYEPMAVSDAMRTFARLKGRVEPWDFNIHTQAMKQEVPEWFGLNYVEGVWKMSGHVTPKETNDHFLFVNLNKSQAAAEHRYHDHFTSRERFHWQSQNSTSPLSKKGASLIEHRHSDSNVHLFVRKFSKIKSKAAPFYYCGRLFLDTHEGEKPMSCEFELETPLSDDLFAYFSG